jgi:Domain of unknown function (DUF4333)
VMTVAVGAVLAACSAVSPRLHVDAIQRDIVASTRAQFPGARLGAARCPAGRPQRRHDTFTCTLAIDRQVAHFSVTQLDDHGRVAHPRMVEPFVAMRDVGQSVDEEVRSRDLVDVDARCGPGVVVLLPHARTVQCTLTYGNGATRRALARIGTDQQVHDVTFVAG